VPKAHPLPRGYLVGLGAAIGLCVVLPYTEEMVRCVRTARARRRTYAAGTDE
jgi:hypothetical protein